MSTEVVYDEAVLTVHRNVHVDDSIVQGPLLRMSLSGGCDLAGCNCSNEPFLCVSDGFTLFSVRLPADVVRELLAGRSIEERPAVVDE